MGTLIFVCPATGLEVFTGLEMDVGTFATLPSVLPDIRCPHCSKPHQLSELAVWLADDEPDSADRSRRPCVLHRVVLSLGTHVGGVG